jgi:hypothetical protein
MKDAKTIRVITKKLRLNGKHLAELQEAQKQGVPTNQAIANLLGIKEGEDPKAFLEARLTDQELEVLRRILSNAKDGSFL